MPRKILRIIPTGSRSHYYHLPSTSRDLEVSIPSVRARGVGGLPRRRPLSTCGQFAPRVRHFVY